ncbi:uncharacterized protein C11orf16 homolog [Takifugu flavidus]|uniref:DUF4537 domain-containing protein n=1 Tax=Takifugu flavidus TaxID=433684 RepID=A0A5C6PA85_9TELE|nr:uncharacterized protein C11orf16 homolog [Takifugu flavidus]TWW76076.1 hypothetical protein D4764_13G0007380 [Takifugu flavidus]
MWLGRTGLAPLVLGERGCSITFVLDTSERMKAVLGSVKRLLIQALQTKASTGDSTFNLVTFSHTVSCWSHHMLLCAPDTVYLALSWIHAIRCSPGDADLLATLSVVFSDRGCHAVHLLCTDLSDHPEAVLTALPALAAGRPVNIFYLQVSHQTDRGRTADYLQRLTLATGGRCYAIPVCFHGELKEVIPLSVVENHESSTSSRSFLIEHEPLRCSLGNILSPGTSDTLTVEFFPGGRVLARRQVDGFYYLGTIIERVQTPGCDGLWVVAFDRPASVLGSAPSQRQLVCSLDMVRHSTALKHSPLPGDAVLSPWEPDEWRYGPGRVTKVTAEGRDGSKDDSSVQVRMWNTCVLHHQSHLVLPISASHHDRIVKELLISSSHRCHVAPCCCSGSPVRSLHRRCDTTDTFIQPDASSSSSSALCGDETRLTRPPAENLLSEGQRPPWRYWRRTGAEPQHRQPGATRWGPSSHPAGSGVPLPRISSWASHSSVFQVIPASRGKGGNLGGVFFS